jgi:hypothetical protein
MRVRTYPGRLNRGEWLRISSRRRLRLIKRAESDLLELWRTCNKKPCRRAHCCLGDDRCPLRPWLADLKHPKRGEPDFEFSFHYPDRLVFPQRVLRYLQFGPPPLPAEEIVQETAAQAGAAAAAALRLVLRLQRRRRRPAARKER